MIERYRTVGGEVPLGRVDEWNLAQCKEWADDLL